MPLSTTNPSRSSDQSARSEPGRPLLASANKVPAITVAFWIIKVLTTGLGESTSDFLVTHMDPIVAVGTSTLLLAGVLFVQFRVRRYVAGIYWSAAVMVAVVGTMVADTVHVVLGVPYEVSTPAFVLLLALIFAAWYVSEKSLSIHTINTRRRELFYWATVMTTFALGTAVGDWAAMSLHLGYLASGVLFAIVIAVPAVLHIRWKLNAVLAFWLAYIVTRPLGASFADWLAVSPSRGGLDLGPGLASAALALILAACLFVPSWLPGRGRAARSPSPGE